MNMNRNSFGISDCYNRVFLFISQRRTEYKKKDEKTTYKYFIQLQSLCGLLKKVPLNFAAALERLISVLTIKTSFILILL